MTKRDDRPLAAARQYLRQREREQKAAAKRAAAAPDVPAPPPPPSGVEMVAATRKSRDARTALLERIQQQVERIVGRSSMGDLQRLADALSLHERRLVRRDDPPPK